MKAGDAYAKCMKDMIATILPLAGFLFRLKGVHTRGRPDAMMESWDGRSVTNCLVGCAMLLAAELAPTLRRFLLRTDRAQAC